MHAAQVTLLASTLKVLFLAAATFFSLSAPACSQEIAASGLWGKTTAAVSKIMDEGRWDLYLSGYAYHGRGTYPEDRLTQLNEKAWGAGIGKTIRNEKGNDESLYAMEISDSHRQPQWMAGYSYQWIYPAGSGGLELGAGVAAMIVRRTDMFGGAPFPAAFPIASVGTRRAKLMAGYVPHLTAGGGKGNVLLVFGKVEFE